MSAKIVWTLYESLKQHKRIRKVPHVRSLEAQVRRKQHHTEREVANRIVLDFCLYCKENGEKVFEAETEPVIREKLTQTFGYLPAYAVDKEYGEVLNRSETRVFPLSVKWGQVGFNK